MARRKNKLKTQLNFLLLPILFLAWILVKLGQTFLKLINLLISFIALIDFKFFFNALLNFTKSFKFQKKKTKKAKKKAHIKTPAPGWSFSKTSISLTLLTLTFAASLYLGLHLVQDLPTPASLKESQSPVTTEFYSRDGTLIYRLYEDRNRTPVSLDSIPDHLVKATIAMEDKNFYGHFGVDVFGVARALWSYTQTGEVQGGSTITQQLIKNTLLTPERTVERKAKEVVLSLWTERIYSKKEILEMYFNEVPYGGPAWGIAAAAQTYFNKDVRELDLAESAFLAGLPASPTTYSPYGSNPQMGKARQRSVLRRMVEENFISQDEAQRAYDETLDIKAPLDEIKAPHFVMYVKNLLSQKYGERKVVRGGLRVTTTIDLDMQKKAEEIVEKEISTLGYLNVTNGAAMVTDAKTGHILAMVGSKNYWDPKFGNFNVATALRQPGSSIKPVTYTTAFMKGYTPGNILLDTPVTFRNAWESYSPVNYDGKYHGPVSIRTALGSSYNVPAVKMLSIVGIADMVKVAKDMGISTFEDSSRFGLSLTLGGGDVRLIDMMTVYGTLSQMGVRYDAQPILKLTDYTGKVLEDNTAPLGKRVIPAGVAYMVSSILADNKARTPAFGSSSLLNISGHIVAAKTGTTDSKRDNWTFGYTPELVVGVWVGNNDNSPMNPALTSGVTGAAPIWNKITTQVLKDKQNLAFERPAEVTELSVDGNKDFALKGVSTKSIVGLGRRRVRDEKENLEKEVITFTDPFSTFQSDQTGQIQIVPPNP